MLIGYARVSKGDDQSNKAQAKALADTGCKRIFKEEASGGRWERPELHRMLDHLRQGDTIVVLEARPPVTLAQGRAGYHGADRDRRCRIPLSDRGDRYNDTGRAHDDADGRFLRRIRARHDPRTHLRRVGLGAIRGQDRRPPQEAQSKETAGNRRERLVRTQDSR